MKKGDLGGFEKLQTEGIYGKRYKESVQRLYEEVRGMRTGAFAPYYQNPLIQSLLVPLGGISGVSLIDFFLKLT